jgi:hypothetical protein
MNPIVMVIQTAMASLAVWELVSIWRAILRIAGAAIAYVHQSTSVRREFARIHRHATTSWVVSALWIPVDLRTAIVHAHVPMRPFKILHVLL